MQVVSSYGAEIKNKNIPIRHTLALYREAVRCLTEIYEDKILKFKLAGLFSGVFFVYTSPQKALPFEKRAPHSRYFSDELGALFIYNNIEHMFT